MSETDSARPEETGPSPRGSTVPTPRAPVSATSSRDHQPSLPQRRQLRKGTRGRPSRRGHPPPPNGLPAAGLRRGGPTPVSGPSLDHSSQHASEGKAFPRGGLRIPACHSARQFISWQDGAAPRHAGNRSPFRRGLAEGRGGCGSFSSAEKNGSERGARRAQFCVGKPTAGAGLSSEGGRGSRASRPWGVTRLRPLGQPLSSPGPCRGGGAAARGRGTGDVAG